jgi:hypothetical protein
MNPLFDEITKDHEHVQNILKKMKESTKADARDKLLVQLKQELIPHMKAEEKAFYSALMKTKGARKNALEAIEEHNVAESVLGQLKSVPAGDEVWEAKLKVLKELIEHHIEEEEEEIFEVAEEAIGKDDFEQIHQAFQEEKKKKKQKLS